MSVQFFITNDKASCSLWRAALASRSLQPNVAGVILAGSADFKTELSQSDLFDGRRVLMLLSCACSR